MFCFDAVCLFDVKTTDLGVTECFCCLSPASKIGRTATLPFYCIYLLDFVLSELVLSHCTEKYFDETGYNCEREGV